MHSTKRFIAFLLCAALCAPIASAQDPSRRDQASAPLSQDVLIIIQHEQVRFTAQKAIEYMQLQVFNQSGELVYGSGAATEPEINWPLQGGNGEALKSGLYAYTLTIKEVGVETALARRGHFIVDRAKDRDGADKLWVTIQNSGGVGAELTVARDENTTTAGMTMGDERRQVQHTGSQNRESGESGVEAGAENRPIDAKAPTAALTDGTAGYIAKFTSSTDLGNSVMAELNGNVGVGTTTPNHRLSIGNGPFWTTYYWGGAIQLENANAIGWKTNTAGNRFGIGQTNGGLYFFRTTSDPGTAVSPANYDLTINDSGSVGIGTTNLTSSRLTIEGQNALTIRGYEPFLNLSDSNGGVQAYHRIQSAHGDLAFFQAANLWIRGNQVMVERMVIKDGGNVGIGTIYPNHLLGLGRGPLWTSYSWGGSIELENATAIGWKSNAAGNRFGIGHTNGGLYFFRTASDPGTTGAPAIYDMGITDAGVVSVRVLEITGGADFAENFDINVSTTANETPAEVGPGMVVSIDPAHPGKLQLSAQAYDRRVAGIISGAGGVNPGMMMSQTGTLANGQHPVALSGRVYCYVDASQGAIEPGDLLTTSATPGHAMKVIDPAKAQGAIIGKAMTGLKEGKGLALVLVTLQ